MPAIEADRPGSIACYGSPAVSADYDGPKQLHDGPRVLGNAGRVPVSAWQLLCIQGDGAGKRGRTSSAQPGHRYAKTQG
ncbi:hypothetical protein D3C84_1187830 [compost metagenome]